MTLEYAPDDRSLVTMALHKDPQAFNLLLQRHKEGLISYIQQHFNIGNAVEDMVFVTFDKAFRKLDAYNPQFSFSTWLYSIAHNSCIDYARKRSYVAWSESEDFSDPNDPETEMIAAQESARLIGLINKLKPIYREPACLRFLCDYAYEDIARALNIPLNTLKIRIHRAKAILSQWIIAS
ncbi:MAG: sigma-70 family RNA polymerase sigma factor [Bacteroidetes bacterium]|nr:sigma-70 family RNA polymerase sigma factor [Bacteroidota bacterium]